ncbi:hypothetical protein [Nonomuraea sp. NPDC049158]
MEERIGHRFRKILSIAQIIELPEGGSSAINAENWTAENWTA